MWEHTSRIPSGGFSHSRVRSERQLSNFATGGIGHEGVMAGFMALTCVPEKQPRYSIRIECQTRILDSRRSKLRGAKAAG